VLDVGLHAVGRDREDLSLQDVFAPIAPAARGGRQQEDDIKHFVETHMGSLQ
jgi:hypothetical protein